MIFPRRRPDPPTEAPEARAGKMLVEGGIIKALRQCVDMGLRDYFQDEDAGDYWRMVALHINNAADELK